MRFLPQVKFEAIEWKNKSVGLLKRIETTFPGFRFLQPRKIGINWFFWKKTLNGFFVVVEGKTLLSPPFDICVARKCASGCVRACVYICVRESTRVCVYMYVSARRETERKHITPKQDVQSNERKGWSPTPLFNPTYPTPSPDPDPNTLRPIFLTTIFAPETYLCSTLRFSSFYVSFFDRKKALDAISTHSRKGVGWVLKRSTVKEAMAVALAPGTRSKPGWTLVPLAGCWMSWVQIPDHWSTYFVLTHNFSSAF